MRNRKSLGFFILILPAILLVAAAFLVPFLQLIVFSFWKSVPGSYLPDTSFSLTNYRRIVGDVYYFQVYLRTVRISAIATAATLIMAYPLSLYIARQRGMKKGILMVLVLLPIVGGGLIQTLGWIVLLLPFGVINGSLITLGIIERPLKLLGRDIGIILGLTQAFMPLMVLPLVASLGAIDSTIEQAAKSLGASSMRVFFEITLPLSLPGVIAGTILVFMADLTSFVTPLLLGQGKIQVFSTLAYQQAVEVLDYPFASAFAIFPLVAALLIWLAIRFSTWFVRRAVA
jgi:ABC-type spermidine/putrescine transport system permease subunit I